VHWRLARRDAALADAVRATATAALPAGTRVVAPRAQLEAAAAAVAGRPGTAGDVLSLLRELSTRVPSDVRVDFDELAVEGDVLRLRGRTDRFESIDAVTRALAASASLHDVVAEDSRAAVDGRGVEFGVRATWRPAVGAPS
jgi:Tfp pilus assembly protein PilN